MNLSRSLAETMMLWREPPSSFLLHGSAALSIIRPSTYVNRAFLTDTCNSTSQQISSDSSVPQCLRLLPSCQTTNRILHYYNDSQHPAAAGRWHALLDPVKSTTALPLGTLQRSAHGIHAVLPCAFPLSTLQRSPLPFELAQYHQTSHTYH